jgi:lipopolysaccharide biosynthesis protein
VVSSDIFKKFWDGVRVIESKGDLILEYEIGLSQQFQNAGFKQGVACKIIDEKKEAYQKMLFFLLRGSYKKARNIFKRCHDGGSFACNTTLLFWDTLMTKSAMPFLKIAVLKHNAFGCKRIGAYQEIITSQGWDYPIELIAQHQRRL